MVQIERRREDLNLRDHFWSTSLAVRRTRPGYATSPVRGKFSPPLAKLLIEPVLSAL